MSGHFCDSTAFGADKLMKNDRLPPKKKNDPEEWRSGENLRLRCQPCLRSRPDRTDQVTVRLQGHVLLLREWS